MLASFLGVLPILTPPLCALALSRAQSPVPLCTGALEGHGLPVVVCAAFSTVSESLIPSWGASSGLFILMLGSGHAFCYMDVSQSIHFSV
jgi:hypothetical protein